MPEIVSCPECERKLACPPEYVGRKVRCPGCSGQFKAAPDPEDEVEDVRASTRTAPGREERIGTAPAGRGPARRRDEEEDDDHPRRADDEGGARSDKERQGWKLARLGWMFVSIAGWAKLAYWLVLLLGVSLLLLIVGTAIFSAASSASSGDPRSMQSAGAGAAGAAVGGALGMIVLMIVLGLVALVEIALRLVGLGLGIMVPAKKGTATKGLAIAAFAVSAFVVLLLLIRMVFGSLVSGFSNMGRADMVMGMLGGGGGFLGLVSPLFQLAGYVLTLLALRSAAVRVREEGAAKQIISLMIAWGIWGFACVAAVILFIVGFGFTIFSAASSASSGSATGAATSFGVFGFLCIAAMGLISLLWAGLYVWYLMIIQKVRRAMVRYTAR
jgi:hypothetical protein